MPKATEPDRISVTSAAQLGQEFHALQTALLKDETEHTWEQIDKALKRFHAVVRGGCARQFPDELVRGFKDKQLAAGITRSLISERTRLSATALDLIAATTRLGPQFAPLLPTYLPTVLRLLCRTNKLYIARASATLISIIVHTHLPDVVKYMVSEWRLESGKSSSFRERAAEALSCILGVGNDAGLQIDKDTLDKRIEDLEWMIKTGATDREPKVRAEMKKCWEAYKTVWPDRVASFTAPMTPIIRRYLNVNAPAPGASSSSSTGQPARKPKVSSSLSSSAKSTTSSRPAAGPSSRSGTIEQKPTVREAGPSASAGSSLSRSTASSRSHQSTTSKTRPVAPASVPLPKSPKTDRTATAVGVGAASTAQPSLTGRSASSSGALSRSASRPFDLGEHGLKSSGAMPRSAFAPPLHAHPISSSSKQAVATATTTSSASTSAARPLDTTKAAPPPPTALLADPAIPSTSMSRPLPPAPSQPGSTSRPFKPTMSSAATRAASRSFMSSSMTASASGATSSSAAEHRKARRVLPATTVAAPFEPVASTSTTPAATPAQPASTLRSSQISGRVGTTGTAADGANSHTRSALSKSTTVASSASKGPFRPQARSVSGPASAAKPVAVVASAVPTSGRTQSIKMVQEIAPASVVPAENVPTDDVDLAKSENQIVVGLDSAAQAPALPRGDEGSAAVEPRTTASTSAAAVAGMAIDEVAKPAPAVDSDAPVADDRDEPGSIHVAPVEEPAGDRTDDSESQTIGAGVGMDSTIVLESESQEPEAQQEERDVKTNVMLQVAEDAGNVTEKTGVDEQIGTNASNVTASVEEDNATIEDAAEQVEHESDESDVEEAPAVESVRLVGHAAFTPMPASPVAAEPEASRVASSESVVELVENVSIEEVDDAEKLGDEPLVEAFAVEDVESTEEADVDPVTTDHAPAERADQTQKPEIGFEEVILPPSDNSPLSPGRAPWPALHTPVKPARMTSSSDSPLAAVWSYSPGDFAQSCSIVMDTPPRFDVPAAGEIVLPGKNSGRRLFELVEDDLGEGVREEEQGHVQEEQGANEEAPTAEFVVVADHDASQIVDDDDDDDEYSDSDSAEDNGQTALSDVATLEDDLDDTGAFDIQTSAGERSAVFLPDESALQLLESSFEQGNLSGLGDTDVHVGEVTTVDDEDEFEAPLNDALVGAEVEADDGSVVSVDTVVDADVMNHEESVSSDCGAAAHSHRPEREDECADEDQVADDDVFKLEPDHGELVFQDESMLSDESSVLTERPDESVVVQHRDEQDGRPSDSEVPEPSSPVVVLKRSLRSRVVTVELDRSASSKGPLTRSTRSNREVLAESVQN